MTDTVKKSDAYDLARMMVDMHEIADGRYPRSGRTGVAHVEKFVSLCERMDVRPVSDAWIDRVRRMAQKADDQHSANIAAAHRLIGV